MNYDYSILINTHERHGYLRRALSYYSDCAASGVSVLVADSSEAAFADHLLLKNISYHHFPGMSYNQRLIELVKLVQTEYVLLAADDDFISPAGISASIDFLKAHPDYSSALGNHVVFSKHNGKVEFRIMHAHSFELDLNDDDPMVRMNKMFQNYFSTHYAVHRKENMEAFTACMEKLPEADKFMPMILSIVVAVNGKIKVINEFYSGREYIIGSSSASWLGLDVLCRDVKFRQKYDAFISVCAEYLISKCEMPFDEAKRKVLESFEIYIEKLIKAIRIKNERNTAPAVPQPAREGMLKRMIKGFPVIKNVAGAISGRRLKHYQETQTALKRNKDLKFGIFYSGPEFELTFTDDKKQGELERIKQMVLQFPV